MLLTKLFLVVVCACVLVFATAGVSADVVDSSLQMTFLIFRHGDRSALVQVPNLSEGSITWPYGLGELTPAGMRQQRDMGKMFRAHYGDFINNTYHPDTFNTRSTDLDRTLASGESQLAGWFPPTTSPFNDPELLWFPLPVHTIPFSEDLLLSAGSSCPRFQQLLQTHPNRPQYEAKLNQLAPPVVCYYLLQRSNCNNANVLAEVGRRLNVSFTLSNVWTVVDTLICLRAHNFTIVPWIDPATGPDQAALYSLLLNLQDFDMYDDFTGKEERTLTGGPLVQDIIQQFQTKLDPKTTTPKKIQLYSAHDTTVASFLTALDPFHFGFQSPPYAAAVAVELHVIDSKPFIWIGLKNNTPSGEFNVIVQPLVVPGCPSSMCPLSTFIEVVRPILPGNITLACKAVGTSQQTEGTPSDTEGSAHKGPYVAIGVIMGIAGVAIIIAAALYITKTKRQQGYKIARLDNSDEML